MRGRRQLILAILPMVAACGGGGEGTTTPPPPPAVSTVAIVPGPAVSLVAGGTVQLSATTRDAQGNLLTNRTIAWTSSADAIASVSTAGLVTAVAPGSAQVTATSEGRSASVAVTVTPVPVASIVPSVTSQTLVPQETASLSAVAKDGQGNTLAGRTITWGSSTPSVATADAASGLVTAMSVGTAQVTATSEGVTAGVSITVRDGGFVSPAGGQVSASSGSVVLVLPAQAVSVGTAVTVTPVASPPPHAKLVAGTAYDFGPSGQQFAQPVTIRLTYPAGQPGSANPAQFRVHRHTNGAWVPLPGGTVDVATRTASANTTSFSTYALIEVPVPVAMVTVSAAATEMFVGDNVQFSAVTKDAQGGTLTGRAVTWTSLTPAIATVSEDGLVHGVSAGTATIRATSEGVSGEATIDVRVPLPAVVAEGTLSTGVGHVCGLTDDGTMYCWGRNTRGQVGDGSTTHRADPAAVSTALKFRHVNAGWSVTCGLTAGAQVYCWGLDGVDGFSFGVLGLGESLSNMGISYRATPTQAISHAGPFVALPQGPYGNPIVCALTQPGAAICWGRDDWNDVGFGTPVAMTGAPTLTRLFGDHFYTCALDQVGVIYCAVLPNTPVLSSTFSLGVTPFVTTLRFTKVSAALSHFCGLVADGTAYCWGRNAEGQLGNNSLDFAGAPSAVHGGLKFRDISSGTTHTCGVTTEGRVACWGKNAFGELGFGSAGDPGSTQSLVPVLVSGPGFVAVRAGDSFTCALEVDGRPWCWGDNQYGAIGTGTIGGKVYTPTPVNTSLRFRVAPFP